jgi:cell division initiation protein
MELTARSIHEKQFHDAWRGYNQAEVDDFLDRVAETVDRLKRENDDLLARLQEMEGMVAASKETEEMLTKTLVTAQRAAEEALANAKAKAGELLAEAEERLRQTETQTRERVHEAEEEARHKLANAEARSRRMQSDAERDAVAKTAALDERVARLRGFETEVKRRLQSFFEQQIAALQGLHETEGRGAEAPSPPRPAAVAHEPEPAGPQPDEPDASESEAEDDATAAFEVTEPPEEGETHERRGVRDLFRHSS